MPIAPVAAGGMDVGPERSGSGWVPYVLPKPGKELLFGLVTLTLAITDALSRLPMNIRYPPFFGPGSHRGRTDSVKVIENNEIILHQARYCLCPLVARL